MRKQEVEEQIQVATLDRFVLRLYRRIKIDEGMKLDGLKSAMETLQRCEPLLYIHGFMWKAFTVSVSATILPSPLVSSG